MARKRASGLTMSRFLNLYAAAKAENKLNYPQLMEMMMQAGGYATPAAAYQAYRRFDKKLGTLHDDGPDGFQLPPLAHMPDPGRAALTWADLESSHGKLLAALTKAAKTRRDKEAKAKEAAAK